MNGGSQEEVQIHPETNDEISIIAKVDNNIEEDTDVGPKLDARAFLYSLSRSLSTHLPSH